MIIFLPALSSSHYRPRYAYMYPFIYHEVGKGKYPVLHTECFFSLHS